MAATKYTYSISADFPNQKVASDRLTLEIQQSAIVTALDYINTSGDDCDIWFKDALSAGDETILDGIVAAHSGEPLAQPPMQTTLTDGVGTPVDISNNRMLVVNFPADFGASLWITGRGDDIDNGIRGRGDELRMSFDDVVRGGVAEEKHVDIQFMERIQLHDGHLDVPVPSDWSIYDEWDFGPLLEATSVTPNGGNTGNCNLVPMAGGAFNAIVPAAGDGAYDVDLDAAIPVPSVGGGWDYDYKTNVLSFPSDPANTEFALLDIPIQAYVQIAVNIPCSPTGVFDFDAYDTQEISPRWKIRFTVRKKSDGPGDVAGWIVGFRESNTEQ